MPILISRVNVQAEIYNAMLEVDRAVHRGEIAKLIGRKNSRWLHGRIDSLVDSGHLKRTEYTWHNGMPVYYYEVVK